MRQEVLLKQCERLIYSRAWLFSIAYNVDFDDVKSQGFLVFCDALEKFDPSKASFPTFLYWRLNTLKDYCLSEKKISDRHISIHSIKGREDEPREDEPIEFGVKYNLDERLLFGQLVRRLSPDGRTLLQGILDRDFERMGKRKRTINLFQIKRQMTLKWGWSNKRIESVWDEVRGWWEKNHQILAVENL